MKFNWGHGIFLGITAFIVFILFMVFSATQIDYDLVSEDYYDQEIAYEDHIRAVENTNTLTTEMLLETSEGHVILQLPQELRQEGATATVHFFRADNATNDFILAMENTNTVLSVPFSDLIKGEYTVKVTCTMQDKQYYFERAVVI